MNKMWLVTVDGDLINADYVVRLYEDGGKIFAELRPLSASVVTDPIELAAPSSMRELRLLLAANSQRMV